MSNSNILHSGFVAYDDTPRRGQKGIVVKKSTPEKFKYYLKELIKISLNQGKEYIFITAWNEWGEGAFLEPDCKNRYEYLESLRDVVNSKII